MQVRQGDVFLEAIQSIPKEVKPHTEEKLILAYGEVTGHCHEIKERKSVSAFVGEDGTLFLDVEAPADLTHQEHGTITIETGKYRVIRQREYFPEEIRNVAD